MSDDPARGLYSAALQLLDRQLIDVDGRPVGKVDDIELVPADDGRWQITALLTGPGALGPRLGGRLGRWTVATWCRLRIGAGASPGRVMMSEVREIGAAVRLHHPDDGRNQGLEHWLLEHVVGRLPGAGEDEATHRTHSLGEAPGGRPPNDARRLGKVLGAMVRAADGGSLGHVNDVLVGSGSDEDGIRPPFRTEALIVSDRHAGSLLGYHHSHQGPWLVRVTVLGLHRHARYVPWDAVRHIDWDQRLVDVDARRAEPLRN